MAKYQQRIRKIEYLKKKFNPEKIYSNTNIYIQYKNKYVLYVLKKYLIERYLTHFRKRYDTTPRDTCCLFTKHTYLNKSCLVSILIF